MDKKSERVLVEIIAEYAETEAIDRALTRADPNVKKISSDTHVARYDLIKISYMIEYEALSFIALSDTWLHTRLRVFPPIRLKDSYRKKA